MCALSILFQAALHLIHFISFNFELWNYISFIIRQSFTHLPLASSGQWDILMVDNDISDECSAGNQTNRTSRHDFSRLGPSQVHNTGQGKRSAQLHQWFWRSL